MRKYLYNLRTMAALMLFNWKSLLLFGIIYNLSAYVVSYTLSRLCYDAALYAAGISYISESTLPQYYASPVTWIYMLILLLMSSFLILMGCGGIIRLYDASRLRRKMRFSEVLYSGAQAALHAIRCGSLKLYVLVLLVLPLLGFDTASSLGYTLDIPDYIMEYIEGNLLYLIPVLALFFFLVWYALRNSFSIHSMLLDQIPFKEAAGRSIRLTIGKKNWVLLSLLGTNLLISMAFVGLFAFAGLVGGVLFSGILDMDSSRILYIVVLQGIYLVTLILPFFTLAMLSALYYDLSEQKGEKLPDRPVTGHRILSRKILLPAGLITVLCLIFQCWQKEDLPDQTDLISGRPEIVAHRGDCVNAPENTMPAFELAVEEGVSQWIELDVQQASDGTIVVCHDDNLERVTGVSACIHELTYQELLKLDFGRKFSEEYAGTKIPTLDQVLDYCKGKIGVQVEVKPNPYNTNLEEAVVDIVRSHDMGKDCIITSLTASSLEKIREIAPDIITVYSMTISDGNVTDLSFADDITVEEQNVTDQMVKAMHAQGRRCFVWTVNIPGKVQDFIDLGVDGILTDDPLAISQALDNADYLGGIARLLRENIRY